MTAPTSAALGAGSTSGGAQAPAGPQAGGSEYGALAGRAASASGPILTQMTVPRRAVAGRPPAMLLRFEEVGVATVHVTVAFTSLTSRAVILNINLGWQHTGRTLDVRWPAGAVLTAGSYLLRVGARDHRHDTLVRMAHASGLASVTIIGPPAPTPKPVSQPKPAPVPTPVPESGVPSPAQTLAAAVFPVAGPHSFGGPENRFGAPRAGHTHEGQDVLAAEGTPILAPLAGAVLSIGYQAGGAGYYLVERASIGFDLMFAHCQAASLAVSAEQALAAGAPLCHVGQTGDATAPHLHLEMWVGGWQTATGHPIDPLPYLQAWEAAGGGL